MSVYEQLADALDRLPNGYPRTESGAEVRLLEMIFSEEEATIASQLDHRGELVADIAQRLDVPTKEAREKLMLMVRRGLLWLVKADGKVKFRLAPFVVGIYEAQLENMTPEMARVFEQYMGNGGAEGVLQPQPALQRVVPAEEAVEPEFVLPYDDVRAILEEAVVFNVHDCICRLQQRELDHECDFPMHTCLTFSKRKRPPREGDVTREEALAILADCAREGLVHTVSNSQEVGYVCNCCGCCCAILRGINEWGIENSVACANYFVEINAEKCTGCGVCVRRCQIDAISVENDIAVIDKELCIGCGVCVTGCRQEAMRLAKKPESEIIPPPEDFTTWEVLRLKGRGMSGEAG